MIVIKIIIMILYNNIGDNNKDDDHNENEDDLNEDDDKNEDDEIIKDYNNDDNEVITPCARITTTTFIAQQLRPETA